MKKIKLTNHGRRAKLRSVSPHRAVALIKYRKVRASYLEANPYCEVCGRLANQLHHKKGRIGDRLFDEKFFLATCDKCHSKITRNPAWAMEMEYSLDRLAR